MPAGRDAPAPSIEPIMPAAKLVGGDGLEPPTSCV
jgi:hypothetical protein